MNEEFEAKTLFCSSLLCCSSLIRDVLPLLPSVIIKTRATPQG